MEWENEGIEWSNMDEKENVRETIDEIIEKGRVFCCTLSVAGQTRLVKRLLNKFDYLIVDEACQSIEPAALIAMQMNAPRMILVGDPRQLPATTFLKGS